MCVCVCVCVSLNSSLLIHLAVSDRGIQPLDLMMWFQLKVKNNFRMLT